MTLEVPLSEELQQILEQAALRYVSTDMAGLRRKPWGKGFTYLDTTGETIRDETKRAWIESIVIPPAWKEVWISPYKNGHILACGRDAQGRKQYRYHPRWIETRKLNKFNQLTSFGHHLPTIREVTDGHLRKHHLTREKVLAIVVRLLESTLIRIGNEEYARKNDTYGLTTLQDDHVAINGSVLQFEFTGKSGKTQWVDIRDRRLARGVKACRDIPGYELFQYYDEQGARQSVDSYAVNSYLRDISGEDFTAKDFRTWGGSIFAIEILCEITGEQSKRENDIVCAVKQVAERLGNTPAVCRNYYIHPIILESYKTGNLSSVYGRQRNSKSPYALDRYEKTLIALINRTEKNKEK